MKIEKLYPKCKNYIWGGERLANGYGKISDSSPIAESWELSFHKDGITALSDGTPLPEAMGPSELGENVAAMDRFPTLIKLIDAKDNLSVQVHPSDSYALSNEGELGKTEMWYVVEAEEGAGIYLGLKEDMTAEEFSRAIADECLTEHLNFFPVSGGECFFIPSGTVHAICRGCLIAEIQQNSNLTYRVYDYGRVDKDGNTRPLHIEKAKIVSNLSRFEARKFPEGILGASKYFTVRKISLDGEYTLNGDKGSFICLTAVSGEGEIRTYKSCGAGQGSARCCEMANIEKEDSREKNSDKHGDQKEPGTSDSANRCETEKIGFSRGDSFIVPAGYGEFKLCGKATVLMTEIRKYYVGIDIGGTFIKGGIVDDLGRIIVESKVPTGAEGGDKAVAKNIAELVRALTQETGLETSDLSGIGMGVPGMIDSEKGEVVYSNNLRWEHFMISDEVEALTGLKVKIANDANVAALGEARFGCGRYYKTTVLLTLGTGVGGGIVLDGKLYEGNRSAGAELGHIVIAAGGEKCTCGRRGCLEAYASATALIRETKKAMEAHPESRLWEIGSPDKVDGRTAFDFAPHDKAAAEVVEKYVEMLGCGIANIANELRPEAIILGGGVSAQGESLLTPLERFLENEIYGGRRGPSVKLLAATLGNSAGLLGAAALLM